MNPENIFSISSGLAALQLLLLVLFPKAKLNIWLMHYGVIPDILSVIYCIYISSFFTVKGGGYSNLQQVHKLFLKDNLLLAGWVHYLAFDLLVGFAIIKGAQDYKISHILKPKSKLVTLFIIQVMGTLSSLCVITRLSTRFNPLARNRP